MNRNEIINSTKSIIILFPLKSIGVAYENLTSLFNMPYIICPFFKNYAFYPFFALILLVLLKSLIESYGLHIWRLPKIVEGKITT